MISLLNFFSFILVNQNAQVKAYSLVLEYADGGSLRSYLENNFDKLTWDDKCNMAYQLAWAVSSLHEEGIIHRDLVILHNDNFFKKFFFNKIIAYYSTLTMY